MPDIQANEKRQNPVSIEGAMDWLRQTNPLPRLTGQPSKKKSKRKKRVLSKHNTGKFRMTKRYADQRQRAPRNRTVKIRRKMAKASARMNRR